jgi:hypothetical protein
LPNVRRAGNPDIRIIITGAFGVETLNDFSPADEEELEEKVFCCFFRTLDQRTAFLDQLRAIAAESAQPQLGTLPPSSFAEAIEHIRSGADEMEVLLAAVRWWVIVKRKTYHAYRLKAEFMPYNTSCAVSFAELDPNTLRLSVLRSLQVLEEEKSRIVDFFGLDAEA